MYFTGSNVENYKMFKTMIFIIILINGILSANVYKRVENRFLPFRVVVDLNKCPKEIKSTVSLRD